jgi:hypothetical protein
MKDRPGLFALTAGSPSWGSAFRRLTTTKNGNKVIKELAMSVRATLDQD